ncbi:MAG: MFS transporter [Clostridia bacterium]|nr:MFS transporter [Clostridia bacterium]
MISLLLPIIYLSFISLGLPDSLLGSAWPVMRVEFAAPLSTAGMISMIICGGTIISSLNSDRLTRKFSAGIVTACSVAMTCIALFGFSISNSVIMLCLWAIPYGLGAGAVDAALNNYVALHFSARHMSWLHAFWGVGAFIGPYIMSACLADGNRWRGGYSSVSLIQLVLTIVLFVTLPVWKLKSSAQTEENTVHAVPLGVAGALQIRGVPYMLTAFFAYCALEATAGLWASSYLVEYRAMDTESAARFASLFCLGMTGGRFLNGFIADRVGDRRLIRIGTIVMIGGMCLVMIPIADSFALAGLIVIGIGCAPVYPSIIHATPDNFGRENSQAIVGIQMASAYVGSTFIPPLFGLIANHVNIALYPYFMAVFALLMLYMTERLNTICRIK